MGEWKWERLDEMIKGSREGKGEEGLRVHIESIMTERGKGSEYVTGLSLDCSETSLSHREILRVMPVVLDP